MTDLARGRKCGAVVSGPQLAGFSQNAGQCDAHEAAACLMQKAASRDSSQIIGIH